MKKAPYNRKTVRRAVKPMAAAKPALIADAVMSAQPVLFRNGPYQAYTAVGSPRRISAKRLSRVIASLAE